MFLSQPGQCAWRFLLFHNLAWRTGPPKEPMYIGIFTGSPPSFAMLKFKLYPHTRDINLERVHALCLYFISISLTAISWSRRVTVRLPDDVDIVAKRNYFRRYLCIDPPIYCPGVFYLGTHAGHWMASLFMRNSPKALFFLFLKKKDVVRTSLKPGA